MAGKPISINLKGKNEGLSQRLWIALNMAPYYGYTGSTDIKIISGVRSPERQAQILYDKYKANPKSGLDIYSRKDVRTAVYGILNEGGEKEELIQKVANYLKDNPISDHTAGDAVDIRDGDFKTWLQTGSDDAKKFINDFGITTYKDKRHDRFDHVAIDNNHTLSSDVLNNSNYKNLLNDYGSYSGTNITESAETTTNLQPETDYKTQVYDTVTKKWYNLEVKYGEKKGKEGPVLDYTMNLTDSQTGEEITDSELITDIRNGVINSTFAGKNTWESIKDNQGNEYYTSNSGQGRFQINTKPIAYNIIENGKIVKKYSGNTAEAKKIEKKNKENVVNKNEIFDNQEKINQSGNPEIEEWKEKNNTLRNTIKNKNKALDLLTPGSKDHTTLSSEIQKLEKTYEDELIKINNFIYDKQIRNAITSENNLRNEIAKLENEVKFYTDGEEPVPEELSNSLITARENLKKERNHVNLLRNQGNVIDGNFVLNEENELIFQPDPIQSGKSNNITLNDDGTINEELSISNSTINANEINENNIVVDNNDGTVIPGSDVNVEGEITTNLPEVTVTGEDEPSTFEKITKGVGTAVGIAGNLLDYIGGPGAIISYVMGKQGLKHAMKEITPKKRAELSPFFMEHFRQTKELAKKGFHPNEAKKFRRDLDRSYQLGLENSVRGTAGDRAKFLASSGVLDAHRSSALLDFAAKDAEMQRDNQDKYAELMMFKENFDAKNTEQDRAEDLQMQMMNKKSAANFTSQAFSNVINGIGGNNAIYSKIMKQYLGGNTSGGNVFSKWSTDND